MGFWQGRAAALPTHTGPSRGSRTAGVPVSATSPDLLRIDDTAATAQRGRAASSAVLLTHLQ